MIVSRAALKGSLSREFDTPGLGYIKHFFAKLSVSFAKPLCAFFEDYYFLSLKSLFFILFKVSYKKATEKNLRSSYILGR